MGASSRPEFGDKSVEESEEFFIDSLIKWKEKIGLKTPFYLAGHSLGGYISAVYTLKYPE